MAALTEGNRLREQMFVAHAPDCVARTNRDVDLAQSCAEVREAAQRLRLHKVLLRGTREYTLHKVYL